MSQIREEKSGAGIKKPGPVIRVTLAAVAGIIGGEFWPWLWLWLGGAAISAAAVGYLSIRCRWTAALVWSALAMFFLAATWHIARTHQLPPDAIHRYVLADQAQLAQVTGRISMAPKLTESDRGGFARFGFHAPGTVAMIDLDAIHIDGRDEPASGRLLVKIEQADHRLRLGDHIRANGWLGPITGPMNPGEYDFRILAARQGIAGRLTLVSRGNWSRLAEARPVDSLGRLRRRFAAAATDSLHTGLREDAIDSVADESEREVLREQARTRLAFLEAILLGNRTSQVESLAESFRVVGLSHLLAISGAHLAILMGLVWLTARLFRLSPSRAALVVLATLALYLFAVPLRTPIVRAGIMAALFAGGQLFGRRIATMDLLCLAALIVLAWRPSDLFAPGFQLSFGAVAGLLLFTTPLTARLLALVGMTPDDSFAPTARDAGYRSRQLITRFAQYLAVNIVAFLIVFPLVAYHFKIITPGSIVLSLLALPMVIALLAVGYLKIALGLLLPSAGVLLAWPLLLVCELFTFLVERAAAVPGVSLSFGRAPSVAWTVAMTMVSVLFLCGWFARKRLILLAAVALCGGWLALEVDVNLADRLFPKSGPPRALTLNTLSVGNGSCHIVRTGHGDEALTIMFDCGSQGHFNIGNTSIVPALAALGISHIDLVVLSHADVDHFNGILDVAEHVSIGRVVVPPQLIARAQRDNEDLLTGKRRRESITSFLLRTLDERDLQVDAVARGWSHAQGDATFAMLWPPADFAPEIENDASLVMAIDVAGKRMLLNGDIDQQAMEAMFAMDLDLRADISDLPHHGSYCEASPAWLDKVQPRIVVQSSGPARLAQDKWATLIETHNIDRYITARAGMIELVIDAEGGIETTTFR